MTTVDDLISQLHTQGWEMLSREGEVTPDLVESYRRGWVRLGYNASRALDIVGLPDQLDDLLDDVIDASRIEPGRSEPHLTQMGLTLGALADVLTSRVTEVEAAGQAARTRLQTSVLASLHAAARATHQVAVWGPHPDMVDLMRKIGDVTETAAMVAPASLHSSLDHLAAAPPAPTTVDGAVHGWAQRAKLVLESPFLVTEYALRRVAGDISTLCRASASVLDRGVNAGLIAPGQMRDTRTLLGYAANSWQAATVWPDQVILQGRSPGLRRASNHLTDSVEGPLLARLDIPAQLAVVTAAMRTAVGVGAYHERAIGRLANRGLWVAAETLPRPYLGRHPEIPARGWVPSPSPSPLTDGLAIASTAACCSLTVAFEDLQKVPVRRGSSGIDAWETVQPPPTHPQHREPPSPEPPQRAIGL